LGESVDGDEEAKMLMVETAGLMLRTFTWIRPMYYAILKGKLTSDAAAPHEE
jgi:hypothetical protein